MNASSPGGTTAGATPLSPTMTGGTCGSNAGGIATPNQGASSADCPAEDDAKAHSPDTNRATTRVHRGPSRAPIVSDIVIGADRSTRGCQGVRQRAERTRVATQLSEDFFGDRFVVGMGRTVPVVQHTQPDVLVRHPTQMPA